MKILDILTPFIVIGAIPVIFCLAVVEHVWIYYRTKGTMILSHKSNGVEK